jgi:ketosteroid isomerase-like protein
MKKPAPLSSTTNDTPDDVEAAFYEALNSADVHALMACWAEEDDIVCVHPGGPRLVGAAAIRAGFEQVFTDAGAIKATLHRIKKIVAHGCAVHNLVERIEIQTPGGSAEAFVVATNVYIKTHEGWRMVAHHVSPGTQREVQEAGDAPSTVH